jgi:RimJ/RimL family protein N-acetyltransferase
VIQQIRIDKDNIHIGRFILDPQKIGFGLGTEALKGFLAFIFEDNDGELSS